MICMCFAYVVHVFFVCFSVCVGMWFSYGFRMVFAWFSFGFRMFFVWLSHGFRMVNRIYYAVHYIIRFVHSCSTLHHCYRRKTPNRGSQTPDPSVVHASGRRSVSPVWPMAAVFGRESAFPGAGRD